MLKPMFAHSFGAGAECPSALPRHAPAHCVAAGVPGHDACKDCRGQSQGAGRKQGDRGQKRACHVRGRLGHFSQKKHGGLP